MVPLIDRHGYTCSIEDKPIIQCFNSFITGASFTAPDSSGLSETDKLYFELSEGLRTDNRQKFEAAYSQLIRRKPANESPWIFNDFLIFVLLCGIIKYSLDKTWFVTVLQCRGNSYSKHTRTTLTFSNLLNDNIRSTDSLTEIVVVFLDVVNKPQLDNSSLNTLYTALSNDSVLLRSGNDFLICISLRAFDLIVLTKETPDAVEIVNLKIFKTNFERRARIVSWFLYFLLVATLVVVGVQALRTYKDFKDYISDVGAIFQITGLALLILFQFIRTWIEKLIWTVFGYTPFGK